MTYEQGTDLLQKVGEIAADCALMREKVADLQTAVGVLFGALCVIAFYSILAALRK